MREALERQAQLSRFLSGMRCSQVATDGDETLILDFGTLTESPDGELSGSLYLVLECPWRIDSAETVLVGWENEEDEIIHFASLLIGVEVASVEVRKPGFDLILRFRGGHTLRIFPDCRAYYHDDLSGNALPWQLGGEAIPASAVSGRLIPS